jgi:hypothetical protein
MGRDLADAAPTAAQEAENFASRWIGDRAEHCFGRLAFG